MERGVRGVTPRLKEKIPLSPTARPCGPQESTRPVDRTRIADPAPHSWKTDTSSLLSLTDADTRLALEGLVAKMQQRLVKTDSRLQQFRANKRQKTQQM